MDVQEALVLHEAADEAYRPGPQGHVALQPLPAQIQEAIAQPQVLAGLGFPVHRERQRFGGGEHLQGRGVDLHLAGFQVLVDHPLGAGVNLAVEGHGGLPAQLLGPLPQRLGAGVVEHHLGDAVAIAEIEEHDALLIPDRVHPPGQLHRAAGVGFAQGAAMLGSIGRWLSWVVLQLPRGAANHTPDAGDSASSQGVESNVRPKYAAAPRVHPGSE